jgi:hypothetical protein
MFKLPIRHIPSPVDLVYSIFVHVQDTVLELEFQGIKKQFTMLQVK